MASPNQGQVRGGGTGGGCWFVWPGTACSSQAHVKKLEFEPISMDPQDLPNLARETLERAVSATRLNFAVVFNRLC